MNEQNDEITSERSLENESRGEYAIKLHGKNAGSPRKDLRVNYHTFLRCRSNHLLLLVPPLLLILLAMSTKCK